MVFVLGNRCELSKNHFVSKSRLNINLLWINCTYRTSRKIDVNPKLLNAYTVEKQRDNWSRTSQRNLPHAETRLLFIKKGNHFKNIQQKRLSISLSIQKHSQKDKVILIMDIRWKSYGKHLTIKGGHNTIQWYRYIYRLLTGLYWPAATSIHFYRKRNYPNFKD